MKLEKFINYNYLMNKGFGFPNKYILLKIKFYELKMEIINTSVKYKVLRVLIKEKKPLGINMIAKLSNCSISEVWRQIKKLLEYRIVLEKRIGINKGIKKYIINRESPLTSILNELFSYLDLLEDIKNLTPIEACNTILKKYYISGVYAVKELCWDIVYPDGFLLFIDEKEYFKAELIRSYFIDRYKINVIKKNINKCEYYFDDFELINKATIEQAIADSLSYYELDPNNIEILYLILIEDINWKKLYKIIKEQYDFEVFKRLWYILTIGRFLGSKIYPSDLFYSDFNLKKIDNNFKMDAKSACYRILLGNRIYKEQWW